MTDTKTKGRAIRSDNIAQTSSAYFVINSFGGLTPFCRAMDLKTSRVWHWLERGYVEPRYHQAILRKASELGLKIVAADLVMKKTPEEIAAGW